MTHINDEESQKKTIIKTAAKLIKGEIKSMKTHCNEEYPNIKQLQQPSALQYVPSSLRHILQETFAGKDTDVKVASIGQSIVQATCPRTVIAPLQIGLAVQMYHHFRSHFLIDSLSALGFCSSYAEVKDLRIIVLHVYLRIFSIGTPINRIVQYYLPLITLTTIS